MGPIWRGWFFELIASMITREAKALCMGYFMNGLKEEIRNWVRLMGPNTRISAFNTARNVEVALGRKSGMWGTPRSRVEGETGGGHMTSHNTFKLTGYPRSSQTEPSMHPNPLPIPLFTTFRSTQQQTFSPIQHNNFRRYKGLCFNCGQRFSP